MSYLEINCWALCDTAPVKHCFYALFTASAESCCLQRLVHVSLILSSWIIPFWVKRMHKFSRIKACLCTSWFPGEHIHILESSACKLIAQSMQKHPVFPSQLSGTFYDSTVPHLPSTAVDFLQFLPSYWVKKESRMLKLRGTWVTSSMASWPAWKFYKDCQFCKPNQLSLLKSPRQAVNYCSVRVRWRLFFLILMIWGTLAWDHHILSQRLLLG